MGVFTDLTYLKLLSGKKLGALWAHLLLQSWWSLDRVSTPVVTTSFSTWKPCINIITMYHYIVWIFLSTFTYQQPFFYTLTRVFSTAFGRCDSVIGRCHGPEGVDMVFPTESMVQLSQDLRCEIRGWFEVSWGFHKWGTPIDGWFVRFCKGKYHL